MARKKSMQQWTVEDSVDLYGIRRSQLRLLSADGQPTERTLSSVFQTMEVNELEFADKIFVLTGIGADDEDKITQAITDRGGSVKSSVVLDTDYLIVNEAYERETTKYTRALELNEKGKQIVILGMQRFFELI